MTAVLDQIEHRRLRCGMDLAVLPISGRAVAAIEFRVMGGFAYEPPEHLGVTYVMQEAITKGTAKRDGRGVNDAFDAIGAAHDASAGRETLSFSYMCLPEFVQQAIDLHAEIIRTPTFPKDACDVAVDLTGQSIDALNDDPQELAKKCLHRQAYGDPLGRHVLGESETLERLGREQIVAYWKKCFAARRMLVAITGAIDPAMMTDLLEKAFTGFGDADNAGERSFPLQFSPGRTHVSKELEQEQVAICFPGAARTDADFSVEQVAIGVLAGGMSGRLFTEVREKQGLVYWVGAWTDQPRQGGMVHVAASSTPQNVGKTYKTLLRELDRLAEDVTAEEVQRAANAIVTRTRTQGDVTRAKANELVHDLFYFGHPVPTEEKLARISKVTTDDVRRYLHAHPRDQLSVVTLGPKELEI